MIGGTVKIRKMFNFRWLQPGSQTTDKTEILSGFIEHQVQLTYQVSTNFECHQNFFVEMIWNHPYLITNVFTHQTDCKGLSVLVLLVALLPDTHYKVDTSKVVYIALVS